MVEYSINRLMKMKSFRKIKPTQNNSLIPMMTVTITIMITIGLISSSLVSGALAEKKIT
ncbi:hypothetical protein NMY3_03693 [Candidatus Nitrosocosmicus oleophilus]|uniref:Uncharacterized protein n=1 Tax=Candidatus Nitrosocosmicus oleophilus TaxID=1353260 RepID=A0A654M319_9ARCH|nr:hypothetical protein NMY3_03693 [Candidatus Nitrosocosmicus oleophilus]